MMPPVPEPAEVLRGTPQVGGPEQVEASARYVDGLWLGVASFSTSVLGGLADLSALEGAAVSAITMKLESGLVPGAAAVEQCAMTAKAALRVYAAEIQRVDREATVVASRVAARLADIAGSQRAIAAISEAILAHPTYPWNAPPSVTMPEPLLRAGAAGPSAVGLGPVGLGPVGLGPVGLGPVGLGPVGVGAAEREAQLHLLREQYRVRWQHAALSWQGDLASIQADTVRWDALVEDRLRAEQRLLNSLDDTPLAQLARLGHGMPGGRAQAIALGLTGEIAGVAPPVSILGTSHPLLEPLLGTRDGATAANAPPSAAGVSTWWTALRPTEQEELITRVPVVVGNLPGLLPSVRDRANRAALAQLRASPHTLDQRQLRLVAGIQRMLDTASAQRFAHPPVHVFALDLSGDVPKAAIGYGDLDRSSHTTWHIAGMNSDAATALPQWDLASRNLFRLQHSLLRRAGGGSAGVIAWLGYETPKPPPSPEVLRPHRATEGAARLAAELDGMYLARRSSGAGLPAVSVVAHSYGTAVATGALASTVYPVDALVMLGSAGLDPSMVPTLDALRVRDAFPGQPAIYATNAPADRLAPSGAALAQRSLPTTQGRPAFGLRQRLPHYSGVIEFPSGGDSERGLFATNGHSILGEGRRPQPLGSTASTGRGYGDPDTQALHTTAQITTQTIDQATRRSFEATALARSPECAAEPGDRASRTPAPPTKEIAQ